MRGVQSCVTGLLLTLDWGNSQDRNGRASQLSNPATVGLCSSHRHWRGSSWEGFTVGISYIVDALTGIAEKSD